jgi:trimeric autotransporter adhesin
MNQVYRVVWNAGLETWVAVSELAKSKSKTRSKTKTAVSALAVSVIVSSATLANAGQVLLGGTAPAVNSIAIGANGGAGIGDNIARGKGEISIGDGAQTGKDGVTSSQSIAIGFDAKAQGDQSVALGANVRASGNSSVAIGGDDVDRLANDEVMNTKYKDLTGVKLVSKSYPKTTASGGGATALGTQAVASGDFATATGMTSTASGTASSAYGVYAQATGGAALAIGAISKANAEQSIALGTNSHVEKDATNSIAIGNGAKAKNQDSIAIGSGSNANSVSLSNQAYLVGGTAKSEMNIGDRRITGVSAGSDDTDGVNVSQLKAVQTTVEKGFALQAQDGKTVQKALGEAVEVTGADKNISTKVADGQVQIELSKTLDLGTTGSIALGNTSVNAAGLTIANNDPTKVVSMTNAGINAGSMTIANVKAGVADTDAVNVSQLNGVNNQIQSVLNQKIEAVDRARSFSLSSNGEKKALIAGNATIDIGVQDVKDRNLTAAKNGDSIAFALNQNLNLKTVQTGNTVIDNDGLSFKTQKTQQVTVDGVTKTELVFDQNGNPVYEDQKNTPSITVNGMDAGNQKISSVAAGEISANSKDAVNGSQLNSLGSSTAASLGGTSTFDASTGTVTAGLSVDGKTYNTVQDALTQVNHIAANANKGFNITTNGNAANASRVQPSDTVDFANTDKNIQVSNNGNNITVDLNKDLNVDSLTTGNTLVNNQGVQVKDTAGNTTVLNESGLSFSQAEGSKTGPSMTANGINAGDLKVTDVKAGTISSTSKDAINGSQLYNTVGAGAYDADGNLSNIGGTGANNINDAIQAVNKNISDQKVSVKAGSENVQVTVNDKATEYTVDINPDLKVNSVTADTFKAGDTTVNNDGVSIKDGPSMTTSGINAGNKKVTSVANGQIDSTSKDAVNGSQLNATNQAVVQYLGGGAAYDNITQSFNAPSYAVNGDTYNNVGDALGALNQADQALGNRINNLGDQLQQAFYSTNQRIDDVEKKANAGIAAAMALENAPYIPGKYTYAAGAAYHGGENAVGVTLRKTADNGRWSLTGGVAAGSAGDPSVRVGISGVIN